MPRSRISTQAVCVSIAVIVCGWALCSCGREIVLTKSQSPLSDDPPSTLQTDTLSGELPEYLEWVHPLPGETVLYLDEGDWFSIGGKVLVAQVPDFELPVPGGDDGIEILLDDVLLDSSTVPHGEQALTFFAEFTLLPGEHRITLRIRQGSGTILEHNWDFAAKARRDPGTPKLIVQVSPKPGSYLISSEHQGGVSISAEFVVKEMLEPGDFLGIEDVMSRVTLLIDGDAPVRLITENKAPQREKVWEIEPSIVKLFDKKGNVTATAPGPLARKYWHVPLGPGKHEAVIHLCRSSGTVIKYAWEFTVVP